MPAASGPAPAASAAEEAPEKVSLHPPLLHPPLSRMLMGTTLQEKPKEKTIFNVKLESFDASSKPKIIKEVKAMNPTLTLVAVC